MRTILIKVIAKIMIKDIREEVKKKIFQNQDNSYLFFSNFFINFFSDYLTIQSYRI